jgi:hypothetical protein
LSLLSVIAMSSAGFTGTPGPHQDGGLENSFSIPCKCSDGLVRTIVVKLSMRFALFLH